MPRVSIQLSLDKIDKLLIGNNSRMGMTELSHFVGLHESTIRRFLDANGLPCKTIDSRHHRFDERFFENVDTEEKAYWLGFIYADGCVRTDYKTFFHFQMALGIADYYHLQQFSNSLGFTGPIKICQNGASGYKPENKHCRIDMGNCKMISDLAALGCGPRKSLTLLFPSEKMVPNNFLPHFIRGYFDGDGGVCFSSKRKTCSVSICGTKEFLISLKEILKTQGINSAIGKRHPNEVNSYHLYFGGSRQMSRFYSYTYLNATILLERKLLTFAEYFSFYKENVKCKNGYEETTSLISQLHLDSINDLRQRVNATPLQLVDPFGTVAHDPSPSGVI